MMERIKEELAYLRLWLGILAVADIGLVGWALTHLKTQPPLLLLGGVVVAAAAFGGCAELHRQITRKLSELSGG